MSRRKDDLLRGYLDGELDEPGRRAFAVEQASDPRLRMDRAAMDAMHSLFLELGDEEIDTPPGLEDAVMARVRTAPLPRLPWWRNLAGGLVPSPWRMAAAGGALMAAGLILGLALPRLWEGQVGDHAGGAEPGDLLAARDGAEPGEPVGDGDDFVRVHFVLRAPEASRVSVVGDFNGWDSRANRLEATGEVWRAVVPLPRGRYEYQFVVNDEIWLLDPAADGVVDDGFGGRNGVLEV